MKTKLKFKYLKDLSKEDLYGLKDGHWVVVDITNHVVDVVSFFATFLSSVPTFFCKHNNKF